MHGWFMYYETVWVLWDNGCLICLRCDHILAKCDVFCSKMLFTVLLPDAHCHNLFFHFYVIVMQLYISLLRILILKSTHFSIFPLSIYCQLQNMIMYWRTHWTLKKLENYCKHTIPQSFVCNIDTVS